MFPIRDHNPSENQPVVTISLIAINVLAFVIYSTMVTGDAALGQFYHNWAMIPARIMAGDGFHTLFTSMFMHGGIMHLAGNVLFLWIFGDNLEDELGHMRFLIFYLVCGLLADAAQIIADPNSFIPTLGASGAIAGVMGGYLLLFPKAKVDVLLILIIIFKIFTVPAWVMLGIWFGLQIFSGLGSDITGGGVAYWAHAGGFIAGFILMLPVWLRRGGKTYWQSTQGHPPHPDAQYRTVRTAIPKVRRK
ncbi:MAG: rhomboid family intramembrane serine protease [Paracoccaceae bacterium]